MGVGAWGRESTVMVGEDGKGKGPGEGVVRLRLEFYMARVKPSCRTVIVWVLTWKLEKLPTRLHSKVVVD